ATCRRSRRRSRARASSGSPSSRPRRGRRATSRPSRPTSSRRRGRPAPARCCSIRPAWSAGHTARPTRPICTSSTRRGCSSTRAPSTIGRRLAPATSRGRTTTCPPRSRTERPGGRCRCRARARTAVRSSTRNARPRETRSRRPRIAGLIGLVAVAVSVMTGSGLRRLPGAVAADKPRAERPVYQVGDKWIRTDGIYVLVRIDKDNYVVPAGGGKESHLSKTLGISKIVLEGRTELELDPPPSLTWPLEVGKWGVTRGLWRSAPPRPLMNFTGNVAVTWQVDAHEDVVTAAGTFPAFRITQKIETIPSSAAGSGQQFGQLLLWYVPDARRFVRAQGNPSGLTGESNRPPPPAPPPVIAPPTPRPAEPSRPVEPTRPPAEPPRREPTPVAPAPRTEPPK